MTDPAVPALDSGAGYRVLARKYRPARFADLIGQEAMVRTLSNAIAGGRLAHAFILTGVRGIGKTTTARIIARALNCIGPDGTGGPTVDPCGVCEHCRAIAEDRHLDVIEMDAASRTGVDDIRELIDGVRYRPLSARYKIYIVDEVHMLSRNAFNALLKTLEEPPEHVKFLFATTEIRKVPVTVLSRCQRFDLRRVDQDRLAAHLTQIAEREGRHLAPAAAALIARAADGSVRDGLSLLDRAIAHAEGEIGEDETRALLGIADRTQVFDLLEAVLGAEMAQALTLLDRLYRDGADPASVIEDLLALSHWLARLQVAPALAADPTLPEAERARGKELAGRLSIPALARAWQVLLKGLGEVQMASQPLAAAEMVLIRLGYAAQLPTPAELVAGLGGSAAPAAPVVGSPVRSADPGPRGGTVARGTALDERGLGAGARPRAYAGEPAVALAPDHIDEPAAAVAETAPLADPQSFAELVELVGEKREGVLQAHLISHVHLVRFEVGRLEIRPTAQAPRDLATRLIDRLGRWTGRRWIVAISAEAGEPTLAEQTAEADAAAKAAVADHPLVRALLEAFPGATIEAVRARQPAAAPEEGTENPESETETDSSDADDEEV